MESVDEGRAADLHELHVQLPEWTSEQVNEVSWPAVAKALGDAINRNNALLVLDGFEVAQHAQRHDELWTVLDLILGGAPRTPVVVSGRAPVLESSPCGRSAVDLPLPELTPKAAKDWLRDPGIADSEVLDAILHVSNGVPLLLKLGLRSSRQAEI